MGGMQLRTWPREDGVGFGFGTWPRKDGVGFDMGWDGISYGWLLVGLQRWRGGPLLDRLPSMMAR